VLVGHPDRRGSGAGTQTASVLAVPDHTRACVLTPVFRAPSGMGR